MTSPIPSWTENGQPRSAAWRSANGHPPPRRIRIADDRIKADEAHALACEGHALLWRGDFQNARQLLQAMARRLDRRPLKPGATPVDDFHRYRQAQSLRARTLGMLLVELDGDYGIDLRRAPDLRDTCRHAYGPPDGRPALVSLRELQGAVGAYEWYRKGLPVPQLGAAIHPHYGVFAPVRNEYLDLVARAPLPARTLAIDAGTGTGVIAALLARRGVERVIATDRDPRALACARDNAARLGLASRIDVVDADIFPDAQAPLIVCNPPWLPGRPVSSLDHAIFDPDGRMLRDFLGGLASHLAPGGEGWLILSDLAERVGLRAPDHVPAAIAAAGLVVRDRLDTPARHPRARDAADPMHDARAGERTYLWRLAAAS